MNKVQSIGKQQLDTSLPKQGPGMTRQVTTLSLLLLRLADLLEVASRVRTSLTLGETATIWHYGMVLYGHNLCPNRSLV